MGSLITPANAHAHCLSNWPPRPSGPFLFEVDSERLYGFLPPHPGHAHQLLGFCSGIAGVGIVAFVRDGALSSVVSSTGSFTPARICILRSSAFCTATRIFRSGYRSAIIRVIARSLSRFVRHTVLNREQNMRIRNTIVTCKKKGAVLYQVARVTIINVPTVQFAATRTSI